MENNQEHEHIDEEECKICESYEILEELMEDGVSLEDAFHDVFQDLTEEFLEDVVDSSMTVGFEEGYTQALRDIGAQAVSAANELDEMLNKCDCGCEDEDEDEDDILRLNFEDEDDIEIVYKELICGEDCGCEVDECEFDEVNEIIADMDMSKIKGKKDVEKHVKDSLDGIDFVHGEEFAKWMRERL